MPSEAMMPLVKRPGRAAPEKRLQHQIRRELEKLGCEVCDLTQPRRTMLPLGLPDLYVRHAGWRIRLWLEVKTERGRLSPWQEAWLARERAAGGHAAVVRSVEDAIHALQEAGAPIETHTGRREMSDATTQPPADVRERVAREIREAAWADPTGLRERQNAEALADRLLAILRAPHGEGEAQDNDLVVAAEYIESRIPEAAR